MSATLPTAVIVGIETFGAERLARELMKNDLRVLGVGEGSSLGGEKNFELWSELPEGLEGVDYIFDLLGEIDWRVREIPIGTKLELISINNEIRARRITEQIVGGEKDWRVAEAYGVYGPGMDEKTDDSVEFLVEALRLAVLNQNLVLPPPGQRLRLMSVDDWVEGVMRTMFLRETAGTRWLLAGGEVEVEEIANTLIDEAKMTRVKVMLREGRIREWDSEKIEENWEKLRWRPEIEFRMGVKETLQYFFGKIEEERRNKKAEEGREKTEPVMKKYEVMVEERDRLPAVDEQRPVKNEQWLINDNDEEEEEGMVGKKIDFDDIEKVEFKIKKLGPETVVEEEEEVIEVREKGHLSVISEQLPVKSEVDNEPKKVRRKIHFRKWRWGIIVGLWLITIVWPIKWVLMGVAGIGGVTEVQKLLVSKRFNEAEARAVKSMELIGEVDGMIDNWGINRLGWIRNYQTILKTAKEALAVEVEVGKVAQKGEVIVGGMFGEGEVRWTEELKETGEGVDKLLEKMGKLEARLSGDWSFLPAKWRSWEQKKARELTEISKKITLARGGMRVLPELLGIDGKRRDYVVLLQNEMELRPGGGFVGSYGILSWEGGKLLNFEVSDVYEADGQLKGHVEPPEEIKKYLGEASWYLRDANWQASFPAAAKDVQWFLEKETGRKVDGVIGINLAVVKSILGVVGEIYIPDFKEKLNKDNLYEQAEFYSESKFFPGSKQKASFLGVAGKYLFEEIKTLPMDKWGQMGGAIVDKLEENEIQLVLNDGEAGKVIAEMGWNGAIYEGTCVATNGQKCVADYLYVVEANLGVNKANYFIYRKMEEVVEISENMIGRVVKINYENTAKNSNWPGGDYKNYVRLYVPAEVNLAEVSVEDGNKGGNKRVYGSNELKIKTVGNKKEIGFLVVVPVGQRRTVEVRYSSGMDMGTTGKFSYLNYIQKQSGFGDTGLVVLVAMPSGWQPLQVQPAASVVDGKLLFNMKLNKDIKMGVEISK